MKKLFIILFLPITAWAQEHARILEYNAVYTISEYERAEIEEYYKIKINSEKGLRFATFQDYFDEFRKIADVKLEISDLKGKKIKSLGRGDGLEIGFNPSYEISSAKILLIKPDYQNFPFIIEITSKIKMNGFISLPTWMPREQFHLAVDKASLIVKRPAGVEIKFKEIGVEAQKSIESRFTLQADVKLLINTYTVTGLPHVDPKMRYQDFYDSQEKVLISPEHFRLNSMNGYMQNWASFGNWYFRLNSDPYELSVNTKEFIDKLDKTDVRQLIRKIYSYMQDRTRYVSIQLGIGGFKSLPTEEVEKFGYGDCKALSTYAKNMLEYAGIKANYILARAGTDVPDVISDFPSNQFNHVYLGIPLKNDTIFLECTSQISPVDYTGTFTDDRNSLWISLDKSTMIRSRVYNHQDNEKKSKINIGLDPSGNSKTKFEVQNKGVFFDEIMIYKSAPNDYVSEYNQNKFTYSDFAIKEFTYQQPNRDSAKFNAHYGLEVKSMGRPAGTKLILPNVPSIPIYKYVKQDELMKFCSVKRGITVIDEIEVDVPDDYWISNLPGPENITSRFGSYQLTTEFDGKKLKIKRSFTLYKGDHVKGDYDDFRLFYLKLEKLESRKLVLNSKT